MSAPRRLSASRSTAVGIDSLGQQLRIEVDDAVGKRGVRTFLEERSTRVIPTFPVEPRLTKLDGLLDERVCWYVDVSESTSVYREPSDAARTRSRDREREREERPAYPVGTGTASSGSTKTRTFRGRT